MQIRGQSVLGHDPGLVLIGQTDQSGMGCLGRGERGELLHSERDSRQPRRLDALNLGLGNPGSPHRAALIRFVEPGDRRNVMADGELINVGILEVGHAVVIVGRIQAAQAGSGHEAMRHR